ncbi:MAG: NADH-quinone oxidoreductase subunit NuoF [Anaerolineaceae bacterium]|nr:NADH-quinone oxidoreductase subunit NuoF [Anaerolineaceae bacterium]
MNEFLEIQKRAQKKWYLLENSKIPVIYLGMASCGQAAGANEVLEAVRESLDDLKIEARIIQVGCIGPCYLEPLMDIALPGQARISYANMTPKRARHILSTYLKKGDACLQYAIGHFSKKHDSGLDIPGFFDLPMLKSQTRIVLRNCGFIDPEDVDHYIANQGYLGFQHALKLSPEGIIQEIEESGLRGRGGAGFPTYKKWKICRNVQGDQKYLICNADEGDPGAFMNRSLIEGDPHAVLEGMLIAGYAIGANHGTIYIRAEYPLAIKRLRIAIDQLRSIGFLGKDILGSGFDFTLVIKEGAGAFVCGEETALIASIEGKRGMPRARPPFPAISGLYGKPTVINNAETLGTVPNILREGAAWYNKFGMANCSGTKTFSLVGKVRRTGLIEVPLGMTLREIIFDIGGGTVKPFKAVQTGGPSGGCLSEEFLDTPVNYESLRAAGSIMGSGGLIILDKDTCVVDLARYFSEFAQSESCGKCAPCRMGTSHLVNILQRIVRGYGTLEDLEVLQDLGETIQCGSLCGLGKSSSNPVLTTLKYFKEEYLAHVQDNSCPAVVCRDLIEYRVVMEKCTGCQRCVSVCPTGAIKGPRSEVHNIELSLCIKCRACYDICRFDAIAGNAIIIEPVGVDHV